MVVAVKKKHMVALRFARQTRKVLKAKAKAKANESESDSEDSEEDEGSHHVLRTLALHALVVNPTPVLVGLSVSDWPACTSGTEGESRHRDALLLDDQMAKDLLSYVPAPPTYRGATSALLAAGDAERHAQRFGSALLFYERAHLYDPLSEDIPARIAAARAWRVLTSSW